MMEYKVPFLCTEKDMKRRRVALGYYINNLLSADKFDIESALPVIKDFVKKDRDILETNVLKIVQFLGKVGSKKVRTPTESTMDPTRWFCKRLAGLLEHVRLSLLFLQRLGYAYFGARIRHEWIQTFFEYKGPHKRAIMQAAAYSILDNFQGNPYQRSQSNQSYSELFNSLYERVEDSEMLPVPLYLALLKQRRVRPIQNWHLFAKNNINFGRNEKENSDCLRFLIRKMLNRLTNGSNAFYEEKQSAIQGLLLMRRTIESHFITESILKRLARIKSRKQYLMFRKFVRDEEYQKCKNSIHKRTSKQLEYFIRAYEQPHKKEIFKKLTWKDKLMLYPRFGKKKRKEIREKCYSVFDGYLDRNYHEEELFYMFKILAKDREFLKKYRHDKRLFEKSQTSSKFRIFYLEAMHKLENLRSLGHERFYSDTFYDGNPDVAVGFLCTPGSKKKANYHCIIMSIKEGGKVLLAETFTKKHNFDYGIYSAAKYMGSSKSKQVYPNIRKHSASFAAEYIFKNGNFGGFASALEVFNQFSN